MALNDKQNVPLTYALLAAIASLSEAPFDTAPSYQTARCVLHLLGWFYFYLLEAYMNVNLSLGEQLTNLSAAAHLLLTLYAKEKGNFIPIQLYFDFMSMVKHAYFSVVKAKVANPKGKFWIDSSWLYTFIFGKIPMLCTLRSGPADVFFSYYSLILRSSQQS